jgi:hypothetical protein
MIYVFALLAFFALVRARAARKNPTPETRRARNLSLVGVLVVATVFGGYALGRDLAHADGAASSLCRP